jgi:hypothetical protein
LWFFFFNVWYENKVLFFQPSRIFFYCSSTVAMRFAFFFSMMTLLLLSGNRWGGFILGPVCGLLDKTAKKVQLVLNLSFRSLSLNLYKSAEWVQCRHECSQIISSLLRMYHDHEGRRALSTFLAFGSRLYKVQMNTFYHRISEAEKTVLISIQKGAVSWIGI